MSARATEIPEPTKLYYTNLAKEQKRLELMTLFNAEQLFLLNQIQPRIVSPKKDAIEKMNLKKTSLVEFIKIFGYPDKTFVFNNNIEIEGGECIWNYGDLQLNIYISNNVLLIRDYRFIKNSNK